MELVSPIKIGGEGEKGGGSNSHRPAQPAASQHAEVAQNCSPGLSWAAQQHPTSPAPLHLPAQRRADDGFVPSALLGSRAGLLAVKCSIF